MDEKVLEQLRALNPMDLVKKKTTAVQDLDKQFKNLQGIDVAKASERAKIDKLMVRVQEQLTQVLMIEQVLKEKDF